LPVAKRGEKTRYGDVAGLEFAKRWASVPAGEVVTGSLAIVLTQTGALGIGHERSSATVGSVDPVIGGLRPLGQFRRARTAAMTTCLGDREQQGTPAAGGR
jgi:hypothetical protein